jgi:hypothetical protein
MPVSSTRGNISSTLNYISSTSSTIRSILGNILSTTRLQLFYISSKTSIINPRICFSDKVPEPADHPEAKAAAAAEDLPAAGQNAASRPDEHQRGHLGQAAQEKYQPHQERGPRSQGAGQLR